MSTQHTGSRVFHIVIADDDSDDQLIIKEALSKYYPPSLFTSVEDGEELLDFLYHRGAYAGKTYPPPDLILLDLNMPRKNGLETLQVIKSDDTLKHLPVVVLTTSKAEEDIYSTYDLGVNSFITKPVTYDTLLNTMRILGKYWFETVELPTETITG